MKVSHFNEFPNSCDLLANSWFFNLMSLKCVFLPLFPDIKHHCHLDIYTWATSPSGQLAAQLGVCQWRDVIFSCCFPNGRLHCNIGPIETCFFFNPFHSAFSQPGHVGAEWKSTMWIWSKRKWLVHQVPTTKPQIRAKGLRFFYLKKNMFCWDTLMGNLLFHWASANEKVRNCHFSPLSPKWQASLPPGHRHLGNIAIAIVIAIFIGPRCPWGPIYVSVSDTTMCRLNWCDSGWWG